MEPLSQDPPSPHSQQRGSGAEAPRSFRTQTPSAEREHATPPSRVRTTWPTGRAWLWFLLQICLVVGIELSDDTYRGFFSPRSPAPAQANAVRVMDFEQGHGFWVEPGFQRFFEQPHHLFGLVIGWTDVVPVINTVYGIVHGLVTFVFAAWLFWRRRALFPFVRNVFIFTNILAVVTYNAFPLAPPRLATGLLYHGRPFHFIDTVFVGGGVDLSFDQYAAMPSLHVAWALIAGVTVFLTVRPLVVRVLALCHPVLMAVAVIITGNHYIMDCIGGVGVVAIGYSLALAVSYWQRGHSHRTPTHEKERAEPATPHASRTPRMRSDRLREPASRTDFTSWRPRG